MKKLLLTALIAAMMVLPLGTVAMADDKPLTEALTVNESYTPGDAPAQSSVEFMAPAIHAVLLAMENRELTSFTTEDPMTTSRTMTTALSAFTSVEGTFMA